MTHLYHIRLTWCPWAKAVANAEAVQKGRLLLRSSAIVWCALFGRQSVTVVPVVANCQLTQGIGIMGAIVWYLEIGNQVWSRPLYAQLKLNAHLCRRCIQLDQSLQPCFSKRHNKAVSSKFGLSYPPRKSVGSDVMTSDALVSQTILEVSFFVVLLE